MRLQGYQESVQEEDENDVSEEYASYQNLHDLASFKKEGHDVYEIPESSEVSVSEKLNSAGLYQTNREVE